MGLSYGKMEESYVTFAPLALAGFSAERCNAGRGVLRTDVAQRLDFAIQIHPEQPLKGTWQGYWGVPFLLFFRTFAKHGLHMSRTLH